MLGIVLCELFAWKPPFANVKFMTETKNCVVERRRSALEYRVKHNRNITLVGRCWGQRAEQRLVFGAMHGSPGPCLLVRGTTRDAPLGVPLICRALSRINHIQCCRAIPRDWQVLPSLSLACFNLVFTPVF